jgi:hypothetical protein
VQGQGQLHEHHFDDKFAVLRRPYGAARLLLARFPTLKRGANHLGASGAVEIGTNSINETDSCNRPGAGAKLRQPESI